jgi:L-ascorbate metabolism protein UlaG (beta-lactamase superfamily)
LQGPEGTVLIDPFLDENPAAHCQASEVDCDAIGVTHGHHDHLGDTVPIARRTDCQVFCTYELANFLQGRGVKNVHPMHIGGSHRFGFGTVKLVPALHGGMVEGDTGKFTCTPCGMVLRMGGLNIYHAGDTGLTMEMELLSRYDSIDAALLPIGDNFTMGPDDALHAVEMIHPRLVIPMHYGTFDVIEQDAHAFRTRVKQSTGADCIVLAPGHSTELLPAD